MSGHSHFAGIKHRKGINDARRAKIFTKLAKPIVIAARDGGGDPYTNFKLRIAIDKAREFNMPKENIERAIKRGTGEIKGAALSQIIYEAVGPGGISMLILATTDNKNRTVGEIKSILAKFGGKMGESGSTMWNFEQVGIININSKEKDLENLEMKAIDAGAKDIKIENGQLLIFCEVKNLQATKNYLEKNGFLASESTITYIPKNTAQADQKTKTNYEKLLELLDEQDDVEEIYDNLEL